MSPAHRQLDLGVSVWDLGPTETNPWLVECPRCGNRAVIIASRLACGWCGMDRTSADRTAALWLRTPCCGRELYAVNERHLGLLEGYLLANLRERRRDAATGWNNRAVTSRLPRWMKAGANRDEVARGLAKLRVRLDQGLRP